MTALIPTFLRLHCVNYTKTKTNSLFLEVTQNLTTQDDNNACIVHSLCGFDDIPGAVVIHVVFTANILTVAMVVMTLGFDFLKRKRASRDRRDRDTDKDELRI